MLTVAPFLTATTLKTKCPSQVESISKPRNMHTLKQQLDLGEIKIERLTQ